MRSCALVSICIPENGKPCGRTHDTGILLPADAGIHLADVQTTPVESMETYDDEQIVRILRTTRTIAVVGASPRPSRYSYRVMEYMQRSGYRVIPVNPVCAGDEILGELVYPALDNVPAPFEMVDVFRRMDAVPGVVDDVIRLAGDKGIRHLWLQVGLHDSELAARARAAGLTVVMDRCVKIEYGRLLAHG